MTKHGDGRSSRAIQDGDGLNVELVISEEVGAVISMPRCKLAHGEMLRWQLSCGTTHPQRRRWISWAADTRSATLPASPRFSSRVVPDLHCTVSTGNLILTVLSVLLKMDPYWQVVELSRQGQSLILDLRGWDPCCLSMSDRLTPYPGWTDICFRQKPGAGGNQGEGPRGM